MVNAPLWGNDRRLLVAIKVYLYEILEKIDSFTSSPELNMGRGYRQSNDGLSIFDIPKGKT